MPRAALLATCLALFALSSDGRAYRGGVNPVLGDASWVARFGAPPGASASERERIETHLAYVEAMLRARDVSGLSLAQRARRAEALDTLAAYRRAGRFPINDAVAGRTPRFIDAEGTPCAVARLIEASAGRAAADRINAQHEWDRLLEMNEPTVGAWAEAHGFTRDELAMIQPSYGYKPDPFVNLPVTTPRPSWKQLMDDIAQRKADVAACVAKKRTAPGPIAVTLDALWDDTHYVIITPTVQPKNPAIEACIKSRLEGLLKRHYGMRVAETRVKARVSFHF